LTFTAEAAVSAVKFIMENNPGHIYRHLRVMDP
jgi:hypothetical protein